MRSITWNIQDEWQPLEAVMVGIGVGMGPVPKLEDTYDPQSRKHVAKGTYPREADVTRELDALADALSARGILIKRPEAKGFNQVFARDIGVVIDHAFVLSSMVEDREQEKAGIMGMLDCNPGLVHCPPSDVRLEGGDIMPMHDEIWVGCANDEDFATSAPLGERSKTLSFGKSRCLRLCHDRSTKNQTDDLCNELFHYLHDPLSQSVNASPEFLECPLFFAKTPTLAARVA